MAKKQKSASIFKTNKLVKQNLDLLQSSIDDLYQDTYYNSNEDKNQSQQIKNDIDASIDSIRNNGGSTYTSIGNMTQIYTKLALKNASSNKEIMDATANLFEDRTVMDNILSTWMENKWVKDLDSEIDLILKYMPRLKEALAVKKDCVLSADHFSKEFTNFHNILNSEKEELFNKRMAEIKKVYKLPTKFEEWYDETQRYGEAYIYIVPYNTAFKKLLAAKNNTVTQHLESINLIKNGAINESVLHVDRTAEEGKKLINYVREAFNDNEFENLTVSFNRSGLLQSATEELETVQKVTKNNRIKSMSESFSEFINEESKTGSFDKMAKQLIPDDLELPKDLDYTSSEMIINPSANDNYTIKVPGCVVKKLDRANIIPIYIEDMCLGYYYFEFRNNNIAFNDANFMQYSDGANTLGIGYNSYGRGLELERSKSRENIISYLAGQLSDMIDDKFINANIDYRKELYMILKHNQLFNSTNTADNANLSITFIPAEDIVHMKFNTDPVSKRGMSDLTYSLFPAKLYASMYITDVLGRLTRGQDKRVYYVKQNIETNISKTLLNVLNQIKKGNFGARQMENLSNILNITGKFNDYLIPISQSGDSPIQFEIMPGQQFSDNSELMNLLEKMAIDPTDIPYDLIESRQSLDYAVQATMSNSKLLRLVYKRQDMVEEFFSEITTKIYNYEYTESEMIEMSLPTPSFLNMNNGAEIVNGTVNYMTIIANMELADETDEVKAEFIKEGVRYYIPSHMNINAINKLKAKAKMNVANKLKMNNEE